MQLTSFGEIPTVFVRLTGRNKRVLEYNALISSAAELCLLPKVDAYGLGYAEAIQDTGTDYITRPSNLKTLITSSGYVNAPLITMREVSVGPKSFLDVEFLAHDLPQQSGFDVLLGANLLDRMKLKIDYDAKGVTLGD